MPTVKIYTSKFCIYCNMAKQLLTKLNLIFEEIDINQDEKAREELMSKHNWRTVPMIFINDKFVGGYDDLNRLQQSEQLKNYLST